MTSVDTCVEDHAFAPARLPDEGEVVNTLVLRQQTLPTLSMRKAIVTFSKNWWTTFVDERDTPPAGAEAAAAAWAGLTPTPANATRMW